MFYSLVGDDNPVDCCCSWKSCKQTQKKLHCGRDQTLRIWHLPPRVSHSFTPGSPPLSQGLWLHTAPLCPYHTIFLLRSLPPVRLSEDWNLIYFLFLFICFSFPAARSSVCPPPPAAEHFDKLSAKTLTFNLTHFSFLFLILHIKGKCLGFLTAQGAACVGAINRGYMLPPFVLASFICIARSLANLHVWRFFFFFFVFTLPSEMSRVIRPSIGVIEEHLHLWW